jgi:antitoxin component HigA of HigAB toxin-antitoxin module
MPVTYKDLLQSVVPRPITTEQAYNRALAQIERLIRKPKRSRAEDDMIELLATLIEQYEIRSGYTDPVLSPRDRLAGLMEARDLSQVDLSRRSGVPRTTINEILGNKRSISKANAVRLAKYFGVAIEEFIFTS